MNKRFISGLAALAVVFSGAGALPAGTFEGFSLTASAEDTEKSGTYGDFQYTVLESGTLEIKYIGKGGEVTIPSEINGKKVTRIGESAFWDCHENLTHINIPDGVTSIGKSAFNYCEKLIYLTIPDSVTTIEFNAFGTCENLRFVTFGKSVRRIDGSAFAHCTSLTNIELPDGLRSIEFGLFYGCTSLRKITIPNSVTYIGGMVFEGCPLESVTIPYSVTKILSLAFTPGTESFPIKGYNGTAAEKYAEKYGLTFISLGDVPTVTPGDIDGKDGVSESDVALLQQYLADWKVTIEEKAADVNCDGKVNEADVALMQQYLADWKVTLGKK